MTVVTDDLKILHRIADDIRAQASEGTERLDTARAMAQSVWSRRQTERKFRENFLTSPARYFRDCQTEIAGRLLANGDDVLSASVKSGFASTGRLHDAVVVRYGMTPGEVRRRGEGVQITFGFFRTQIGVAMIGATDRGLCWLALCGAEANTQTLADRIDELQTTYPNAIAEEIPEDVQHYADQLVAYLDARTDNFCPPVDVLRGTTFQREVWAELRALKPGETVSYGELARRIGNPKAVRAVASACGSNTLAIAIPCHRCIGANGSLTGYRWGVEWKARLLDIEKALMTTEEA